MTGVEKLDMATAKRQHAQAPGLQETAVEAMFLEELAELEEDSPSAEDRARRPWQHLVPLSARRRPTCPSRYCGARDRVHQGPRRQR